MSMIEVDWNPDTRKLRQFGWFSLAGFGVLGAVLGWRFGAFEPGGSRGVPYGLWILAVAIWLVGLVSPKALKPVYVGLTLVTLPIGLVVSNVALLLVFGLIFVPIGVWFRLTGRDELKLRRDVRAQSYWLRHPAPGRPESYYRQF